MKWIVTLAAVVAVLASLVSIYFTVAVVIPSVADVQAETKHFIPDMRFAWIYTFGKEGLNIFLAAMATYLSWQK